MTTATQHKPENASPVAIYENMTVKDMKAHFQEGHGHLPWNSSKWTKQEWTRHHAALHRLLDVTERPDRNNPEFSRFDFHTWEQVHTLAQNYGYHVHTTVALDALTGLSPDAQEMIEKAKRGERPTENVLSVTERKALEALVNNDFNSVKANMKAFALGLQNEAQERIEAEYAEREKEAAKTKAKIEKAAEKARETLATLAKDAEEAGFTLAYAPIVATSGGYSSAFSVSVKGKQTEINDAKAVIQRDLDKAIATLEAQRQAALRMVLLAGVSDEGAKLLGAVPSAKTLMLEAAAKEGERAKEITQ
jgi:hypothetical protein